MQKIFVLFLIIVFSGCIGQSKSTEALKEKLQEKYQDNLEKCQIGCQALQTLKEEADDKMVCKEGRNIDGLDCAHYCTNRMIQGDKNLNPECWTTLTKCEDFEEKCNFGELYP